MKLHQVFDGCCIRPKNPVVLGATVDLYINYNHADQNTTFRKPLVMDDCTEQSGV